MLFVDKRFFVIIDDAFGKGSGDIDLHFQFGPGKALFDNTKLSVQSDFSEGWNVMVKSINKKDMKLVEEEGQVSFEYTRKEPRPAFRSCLHKETNETGVRFVTILVPYNGIQPEVNVRLIGKSKPGASKIELEIISEGEKRRISYALSE